MLPSTVMKRFSLALLLVAACVRPAIDSSQVEDWRAVLRQKEAWLRAAPPQQMEAKQRWADALGGFCRRYPSHLRAARAREELELEFARELWKKGHRQQAVRFYKVVLERNPKNDEARRELARLTEADTVSREELTSLSKGMSQKEVSARLGTPLPGWKREFRQGSTVTESWYYSRTDGGVAGVYFADGRLFAAEFNEPIELTSE